MRAFRKGAGLAAMVMGVMGAHAVASPFTLSYCVSPAGAGLFEYTFTLTLDNHDQTWAPGRGLAWVVFGDTTTQGGSPLSDFAGDPTSFPIGPWTGYGSSAGGHNGPTLLPVVVQTPPYPLNYWIPAAVGDHLTWRGTSANNVPAGQLAWSALYDNGGPPPNYEMVVQSCGETCGSADFNHDGDTATDADIEDFFRCVAGSCCATCGSADFNGDGDTATDADIEAFFRVLAGGNC